MSFRLKIFTEAYPDGRYMSPRFPKSDPYEYSTESDARSAFTDAIAGMRCAGVDTTWVTHMIEETTDA